ncbi:hypothetical protein AVEN_214544-1 [Araneus ventricosus]|uniref:Uncharacterized protein n=1 Tax=Araneus ventricosus TaxID=182803 RepID=A0A4Y2GI65_ARAVE|nr:hypothetical protein AVEN_214544-1 [Araneus ventricosus]
MADTKQVSLESDSETFAEASRMSVTDQSGRLSRTDSSVSAPPAKEAFLSANEISQDASESSGTIEPFSGESGSTLIASQTVGGVSEDEQQPPEDDPAAPLISPRYEDFVPPVNASDDRTSEPPPPQRPSYIQCMCCCYITTYNIHEDRQKVTYYIHYTRKIRNSKFILLVLAALLSIPISSIYFGVAYKESCPMARFLPVLLILMGVVGVIFIVVRLVTISTRRCLCNVKEPSKTISISLTFMLMVFMATEMLNIYSRKPVFDNPKDPSFCEKAFYDYVFYMNFAVLVIGILALLLHIPKEPRSDGRVIAQEHFEAM